jgi:alkylation response protein AidB-like acyl-CoA dehydrogenase
MAAVQVAGDGSAVAPALARIAAQADALDRRPRFPREAFAALRATGMLALTLGDEHGRRQVSFERELELLRAVSRADGSVGRILDGHLNAVERLSVSRPGTLVGDERRALSDGELLVGVWGADPAAGEGEPARLIGSAPAIALEGVKTYCSGAGGVQRALVVARDGGGARRLVYVDVTEGVEVDRSWYRGEGLRASESHRVKFDSVPVLAILGGPEEMGRQPWFARDAIRTSATWAGIADQVVESALELLAARGSVSDLMALSVGRLQVAQGTIDRWLSDAARCADDGLALDRLAVHSRYAISCACREILADAARSCGSHPLAVGGALSRARRDLDLFLLQHRLDPLLVHAGRSALQGRP